MVAGAFLVLFAINYLIGRRANNRVARRWAAAFAGPGGVFARNFALIGPGDDSVSPSAPPSR
eukprot:63113-Prorocentrum_minimum.AAC.1